MQDCATYSKVARPCPFETAAVTGTDPQSTSGTAPELTYFDYFGAIGADILRLCKIVWGEKSLFGFTLAVSLLVGGYIALFSQDVFRAQTLLSVRSESEGGGIGGLLSGKLGGGISSLVGIQGDRATKELIAGLRSRSLIYSFIQRYGMDRVLFPGLWDDSSKSWKMVRPGLASRMVHWLNGTPLPPPHPGPTLEQGYRVIATRMLGVSLDADSGTITVSFDWHDPQQAAVWANGLVAMFNDKKRGDVITNSRARINFLQAEVSNTSGVETREALANLIQSEAERVVLAQSERQFSLQIIDPATPPEDRVWPKRGLIMFLSLLIGLVVGAGACLVWSKLKHAIPLMRFHVRRIPVNASATRP